MELVSFRREGDKSAEFLCLFLSTPVPICHVKIQRDVSHLQDRNSALARTKCADMILDFLASRAVRDKCLWFKPLSLWHFVTAAQADECTIFLRNCRWLLWTISNISIANSHPNLPTRKRVLLRLEDPNVNSNIGSLNPVQRCFQLICFAFLIPLPQ